MIEHPLAYLVNKLYKVLHHSLFDITHNFIMSTRQNLDSKHSWGISLPRYKIKRTIPWGIIIMSWDYYDQIISHSTDKAILFPGHGHAPYAIQFQTQITRQSFASDRWLPTSEHISGGQCRFHIISATTSYTVIDRAPSRPPCDTPEFNNVNLHKKIA